MVDEPIAVSDSPLLVPPAVIVVDEPIGVSDSPLLVPPAVVSVDEAIAVSEAITSTVSLPGPIGLISQQAKLTASDGVGGEQLGRAVAISGDTAVLGAPFADGTTTTDIGAVYVFVKSSGTWSEQARLEASDANTDDNFGGSVAIDGDTIVVGSEFDVSGGVQRGSAYVFTRSGTTWTEQAKLLAGDGAGFDRFGSAVAISSDTIVIGAQSDGSAYVFVGAGSNWAEEAKLVPSDGAGPDIFGDSVDIDGDTVVIGAPIHTHGITQSGSAYIFVRSGTTWTQQAELLANAPVSGDRLGNAVGISVDTVVVGAELADNTGGVDAGSAYVFTRFRSDLDGAGAAHI